MSDPRDAFGKPPFDKQENTANPGSTSKMNSTPDHCEETYQVSGKLHGLNALVTGGYGGIGRAVTSCYAREVANVVIYYLSQDNDAEATKLLVEEAGFKAVVIRGDLRDESFCEKLLKAASIRSARSIC